MSAFKESAEKLQVTNNKLWEEINELRSIKLLKAYDNHQKALIEYNMEVTKALTKLVKGG